MTLAIALLPTAVSLTSTVALLVSLVSFAPTLASHSIAATRTTVALSAIATHADGEHCTALGRPADLQAKDRFGLLDRVTHLRNYA